ncbi:hypothetical protein [Clostridium rectalis]|uniref:hypothetical protein n=1 Tax=Clostridium rectalis TaxID=2040295 RepID=UPI000F63DCA1|nr:hypothetical protein [Clostridium rectalis]
MILAIEILAILTMCTLTFIAVWSFITLKQIFNQLKYKNYLLEKLNLHIYTLSQNIYQNDSQKQPTNQDD